MEKKLSLKNAGIDAVFFCPRSWQSLSEKWSLSFKRNIVFMCLSRINTQIQ